MLQSADVRQYLCHPAMVTLAGRLRALLTPYSGQADVIHSKRTDQWLRRLPALMQQGGGGQGSRGGGAGAEGVGGRAGGGCAACPLPVKEAGGRRGVLGRCGGRGGVGQVRRQGVLIKTTSSSPLRPPPPGSTGADQDNLIRRLFLQFFACLLKGYHTFVVMGPQPLTPKMGGGQGGGGSQGSSFASDDYICWHEETSG